MLRSALRFIIAAAVALAVWWYGTPAYDAMLARAATVLHFDRRFADVQIVPAGRAIEVRDGVPPLSIPADQLTYNFILLAGLFAMNRNLRQFILCAVILAITHWLAFVCSVESSYAQRFGDWSAAHYGDAERYVWALLEYFYRLVGMFGIAFACWWVTAKQSAPAAGRRRGSRKRPGRK